MIGRHTGIHNTVFAESGKRIHDRPAITTVPVPSFADSATTAFVFQKLSGSYAHSFPVNSSFVTKISIVYRLRHLHYYAYKKSRCTRIDFLFTLLFHTHASNHIHVPILQHTQFLLNLLIDGCICGFH